jgi:hypothetical protein
VAGGLVALVGVEGELADEFAGVGVDDADVQVPGELTVTPGEANTAPELGRASSLGAGRRPPKL